MSTGSTEITPTTPYERLPEWLSIRQAAAHLGLSSWFVYQAIHRGDIPYRRIGPKVIQIPKDFFNKTHARFSRSAGEGAACRIEGSRP
jgi:excisionase family DNA binding protein